MSEAERMAAYLKSTGNPLQMAAGDMITELLKRIAKLEKQLPKEGEWIMDCLAPQMDEYRIGEWAYAPKCSECGTHWDAKTNYCPNCGARMRKGGNA